MVLEVAHSGHVDALGALWIAICGVDAEHGARHARGDRVRAGGRVQAAADRAAAALLETHPRRATRRSRALVLAALYFPFRSAGILPLGAIPNVVAAIRFNGPLFRALIPWVTPQGAAAFAVLAGLGGRGVDAISAAGGRSGGLGLADGRLARRRAGRLSVVPPLLHAVSLHPRGGARCSTGPTRCSRSTSSGTSRRTDTAGSCRCGSWLFEYGAVGAGADGANGAKGAGARC